MDGAELAALGRGERETWAPVEGVSLGLCALVWEVGPQRRKQRVQLPGLGSRASCQHLACAVAIPSGAGSNLV